MSKEELDKHEENDHLMDEKSGTEPTKTDKIPLKAESKVNLDDDVSEEDGKKFNCNQCTKSDFHKSDLLRHMKKYHDTVFCDSCSQSFSKLPQLKKHTNQFCHTCMEHIGIQLKRHMNLVHKNIQYSYDKCVQVFVYQGDLQRHLKTIHKNIRYSCEQCEKMFDQQGNLQRHIKSDH